MRCGQTIPDAANYGLDAMLEAGERSASSSRAGVAITAERDVGKRRPRAISVTTRECYELVERIGIARS